MKLTIQRSLLVALWLGVCVAWTLMSVRTSAQAFTTTTVQGTVYLANGHPGSGTLQLSWPAFTTAGNHAVTAGRTNVTIGADGYLSVNLAPNLGSMPAGLYYTAVYHLSDGTTSTEYWVVPAAGQVNLSQVRAQVMPAAQAVQAVSKGYVDQSVAELTQSLLTASGGSLSGPLFLNGDPTQPVQAATKRYVDKEFALAVPLSGGVVSGPLTSVQLGAAYQVDQFPGADFGAKLQACLNTVNGAYGGTCDARNFTGTIAMSSTVAVTTANATVQLPCATIATASQIQVAAGTRNVTLHGCALRGASDASGSQGGTVFLYSGAGPMIQVGDPTYATNTVGFHLDNVVINTTPSANAATMGFAALRTQELNLESLYLLGNSNQTGMTLDGTGNYTGGTFQDIEFGGFGTALNAIGHQVSNPATTDWLNASTFLRLHINCPISGGSPTPGTYGINLVQGDGNTFTGGDVEGCATALHLGQNAQNNTIVGLRNENSTNQVIADAGSSYNNWITGGTMFTGQLTDNGTRNSFLDTFHRSFNGLNGDWYGSQKDGTVTNHYRIGTGTGNERGLLDRYQTDGGYRWTTGLSDATAGEQFYQVLDELNNVYRLSIGQYNRGQSSTNNQTVINAAGTGAVVLNGSANSGTGGVIVGAGGPSGAAVATINGEGNAQFNGSLQVGGPSTFTSSTTVKNQSDAEVDSVLWAGSTANQKESVIYKDYTGASQWYMVKDATNNWALNSALGGLDSFKAYQSNNSGDTYVNASNPAGHIRLNYETGSGAETDIYSGTNSSLVAAFLGTNAIKFPGLASASGRNCLQIDNSGYISNTGTACGTGSGGTNGTVNSGNSGQVAYYAGNGTVIAGTTSVGIMAGGTGATTAQQARQNLGAQSALPGVTSDGASGVTVSGNVAATATVSSVNKVLMVSAPPYNAKCDGVTDDQAAIQAAFNDALPGSSNPLCTSKGCTIQLPAGTCVSLTPIVWKGQSFFGAGRGITFMQGGPGVDVFQTPDNTANILQANAYVHDLSINIDVSVNAAATAACGNNTYPNRVAGTLQGLTGFTIPIAPAAPVFGQGQCSTGGFAGTAGSTSGTLTCSFPLSIDYGFVDPTYVIGAPITIIGAGVGGSDYTGTITGVTRTNTSSVPISFTPALGTSVTNAKGTMLTAHTPPWYIGNAGIAFQCSNGSTCTLNAGSYIFRNLEFNQVNHGGKGDKSHSTGIFTQVAMYANRFENIRFNQLYGGYVEAAPFSGTIATGDTATYKDIDIFNSILPFVTYNGNDRVLTGINIYEETPLSMGPFFLAHSQDQHAGNLTWTIHSIYMEGGPATAGEYARFMQGSFNVTAANFGGGNSNLSWTEFAGGGSSNWYGSIGGSVHLDSSMNTFRNIGLIPTSITDNGMGNIIETDFYGGNNYYHGRKSYSGSKPARDPVGELGGSYLATGNSATPYLNASDLLTSCEDWALTVNPTGTAGTCVSDPSGTEITRSYYHSAAPTSILDLINNGGVTGIWTGTVPRTFGTSIPQTKVTFLVLARCVGTATCTGTFRAKDGTTNANFSPSLSLSLTSSWTLQSVVIDLTGSTYGDVLDFRFDGWTNAGTNWDLASVSVQPVDDDEHTWLAANGLPVSASVNLKVVDTTGAGITTGPTSSSDGHMAVYDGTSGKIKDGGTPPAALFTNVPAWLQNYGDGSEGALSCTSGTCSITSGSHYFTSCGVSVGAILAVSSTNASGAPLFLHCSTSATIAGTVSYSQNTGSSNGVAGSATFGGGAGGGGFGAANGGAGGGYVGTVGGGTAGISGVSGGNGTATPTQVKQLFLDFGAPYLAANQCGGSTGGAGGSSGGAGGRGGGCIVIVSPSFSFTGTCDVSGVNGTAGGSNTGGGGGGAGGICLFRSPAMTNSGTFTVTGGAAGAIGTGTSTAGGAGANGWSKVFTQ